MAAAEDTLTIAPPGPPRRVDITCAAARAQRIVPSRFTSSTVRITSTGVSARSPRWAVSPALFTNPVTGPSSAAAAKSPSTADGSTTSAGTATARTPKPAAAAATFSAAAAFRR